MSSRALRKLQEKTEAAEAEDEPSEEEFRDNTKQKGFNAFLLVRYLKTLLFMIVNSNSFLQLNESCSESEVKEDDDLESCKDPPKVVQAEKKKRKRKKKTGKKLAVASSEDNIDLKADHDDIDETVRWVEANEAPAAKATSLLNKEDTEVATVAARKVLLVENKHLNPENEMKRIFGSRVVASENTRHKKGNKLAAAVLIVRHFTVAAQVEGGGAATRCTTAPRCWSRPSPPGRAGPGQVSRQ